MDTQLATRAISLDFFPRGTPKDIRALLSKKLNNDVLIQVALAGAEVIKDAWKAFELPHNFTGEYQATIQVRIVEDVYGDPAMEVGTPAKQARFLEFGTSKEQAQPVMRPAYDYALPYARARMLQKIIEAVR